jgi:two-component system, NtrC family, nitrogen regulation sensor histidine kinase GlnL
MAATAELAGLDLLATAILLVDARDTVRYANAAAENLFEVGRRTLVGAEISDVFTGHDKLAAAMNYARAENRTYTEHDLELAVNGHAPLRLSCTVSPVQIDAFDECASDEDPVERPVWNATPTRLRQGNASHAALLLEFRQIEQQVRIAREERLLDQSQANRELIRNLAHEIKNPLGGIRGAAQLLDRELDRPNLHEYTQVIMKEADRLQSLMDRLLTPHRLPRSSPVNIHEVLERVRSVILAEYPDGIAFERDYDASLPPIDGDREQLIQTVLNVVRNAAQAMKGSGLIRLRTRIARQVTLARRFHKRALQLQIADNGPGIPELLRERVFHPLVSGRDGGSGLGLTLAQTFVAQHHGTITFESRPRATTFTILLPFTAKDGT